MKESQFPPKTYELTDIETSFWNLRVCLKSQLDSVLGDRNLQDQSRQDLQGYKLQNCWANDYVCAPQVCRTVVKCYMFPRNRYDGIRGKVQTSSFQWLKLNKSLSVANTCINNLYWAALFVWDVTDNGVVLTASPATLSHDPTQTATNRHTRWPALSAQSPLTQHVDQVFMSC